MRVERVLSFDEIKHVAPLAPEFFPQNQETMNNCYVFIVDDFCYVGFRALKHHPTIAEVMMRKDFKKNGSLNSSLFKFVLKLTKQFGFERMALFAINDRLKNIYLKKGWVELWGNGWLVSKESMV